MIGIDKIGLHTKSFSLKTFDGTKFGVKSNYTPTNHKRNIVAITKNGHEIEGHHIYHNSENFNLDINNQGLLVSFNPSKFYHPYQLNSDMQKIHDAAAEIETKIHNLGIDFDINSMEVSRVDIAKQREMKNPVSIYAPMFSFLRGKRMKGVQYPSGYRFGNTQGEVTFYDKREEIEAKQKNLVTENNLMRCEAKWRKKRVVGKGLKVGRMIDIYSMSSSMLDTKYSQFLNDKIFNAQNRDGVQLQLNYHTEKQIFEALDTRGTGYGQMSKYLQIMSIDGFIEKWSSIENFLCMLSDIGKDRKYIYRAKKQLYELLQFKAQIDSEREEITVTTMFNEVQNKFIA